jgi:hypothetical protein
VEWRQPGCRRNNPDEVKRDPVTAAAGSRGGSRIALRCEARQKMSVNALKPGYHPGAVDLKFLPNLRAESVQELQIQNRTRVIGLLVSL